MTKILNVDDYFTWADVQETVRTTEIGYNKSDLRTLWVIKGYFNDGEWGYLTRQVTEDSFAVYNDMMFDDDVLVMNYKQAREAVKILRDLDEVEAVRMIEGTQVRN
jgi:hypothetical protein